MSPAMRLALTVFLPLVVAYGDTMKWIWDRWMWQDSYYSHGPILPLDAGVLALTQGGECPRVGARVGWTG